MTTTYTTETIAEMLSRITQGEYCVETHDARGDYVRICLVARSSEFVSGYYVIAADDIAMRREQAIADYRFYAAAPTIVRQLLAENTELRFWKTQQDGWIKDVDEREAACCPEDVGFDEYIRTLLAERDTLLSENSELQDFEKRARWFLESRGYRRCDIPACNCPYWHQGDAEQRLAEIGDAIEHNGKTILQAVQECIAERDTLLDENKQLKERLQR